MPSTLTRTEGTAAFKEWAVSCEALGEGRQVMLLRKGGISEKGRSFTVDHPSFFLYPTFEHQDGESVKPEAQGLLGKALAERPAAGRVVVRHWAKVDQAWALDSMAPVLAQDANHIYSERSVRERWDWHPEKPLWLLLLRVHRLQRPLELEVLPGYGGCRSWIDLSLPAAEEGLPCEAVLDDAAYAAKAAAVRTRLGA